MSLSPVGHDDAALPVTKRSAAPKNLIGAIWLVLLTALSGISAYYHAFTGFGSWDDEGGGMVTVKQYLGGMKLIAFTFRPK